VERLAREASHGQGQEGQPAVKTSRGRLDGLEMQLVMLQSFAAWRSSRLEGRAASPLWLSTAQGAQAGNFGWWLERRLAAARSKVMEAESASELTGKRAFCAPQPPPTT